jgi:hypothetical protein
MLQLLAELQGMAAQALMIPAGVDQEHLLEYVGGNTIGHQRREMSLPVKLRGRPAMLWPVHASFQFATRRAAESCQPHRRLAEQRGNSMLAVILHVAGAAA